MTGPQNPTTGTGEGGCVGVPTLPNLEINTNCTRVKLSTKDADYLNNLDYLFGKTSGNHEEGYAISNFPIGTTGVRNKLFTSKPETRTVDVEMVPETFAIMHSHFKKLHPIFSPKDLIEFSNWLKWAKSWNAYPGNMPKIKLNNLTSTVVTDSGTYLISFDSTDFVPLPEYTQKDYDILLFDYIEKLNKTGTVSNSGAIYDMNKLESEFLKFVRDKMPIQGLKLYKIDNDDGSAKEIYLENGNRKIQPCP